MQKIKPSYSLLLRKFKNVEYAQENPDKNIDLFNKAQEYVGSLNYKHFSIPFEDLTEQNEQGIGRPKLKRFLIKSNRTKFTIRNESDQVWNFLPYMGVAQMKHFLRNVDAVCNVTETISKILRGDIVSLLIPENRIEYLKSIYLNGSQANPYFKEEVNYIKKKVKSIWSL